MKTCLHCGKEFERHNTSTCSPFCTHELKKEKRLNGWINSKKQEPITGDKLKERRAYNRSLWFMPTRKRKAWVA